MGKIKSFIARHKKKLSLGVVSAIMACFSCVNAFAAEATTTPAEASLQQAFSDGITSMGDKIMGYLLIVVPIALGIVVAYIAIKKGLSFMRSLIGR